jgi:hypothetical protein
MPMPAFMCVTCGSQFAPSDKEPARCPICDEERQFVPPSGQSWTTHEALARRHCNCFRQHEPGLIGIGTIPVFAIGQRALLLRTGKGNVLWDCISLLDEATVAIVNASARHPRTNCRKCPRGSGGGRSYSSHPRARSRDG